MGVVAALAEVVRMANMPGQLRFFPIPCFVVVNSTVMAECLAVKPT